MKKLDGFILKAFIGPFFATLFVVLFILMMQFLWLYIDELVGKGLSFGVIMEFMAWGSATLLPLSLPLATLLSSTMTLGNLSENNELIAIKSAGVSLTRVLIPIMICSVFISIAAFFAANNLVPIAFNQIYTLRDDIGRTKSEINIPTGTFYDGLEGYVLRVDSRDRKTGMMHGVMVYDHSKGRGNDNVTIADSAMMRMSKRKDYITFELYNGVNYQETNSLRYRDTTLKVERINFSRQSLIIPLENYAFQKSGGARYGDQVKSRDLRHLRMGRDSLRHEWDSVMAEQAARFRNKAALRYEWQLDTSRHFEAGTDFSMPSPLRWTNSRTEKSSLNNASSKAQELKVFFSNNRDEVSYTKRVSDKTNVEILRKFAQALACFIMFFLGAPLGAFANKRQGLGVSLIISVLFFVLYWVVDISGVKLANDGATSAAIGVFTSTAILFPIGLFLSWRAINDAKVNTEQLGTWWRMIKSKFMGIFRKTRIVYMGTPEFAVAPLEALLKQGYKVVGVVTVADKPSGRGMKLNESPVKIFAREHDIPVLQPLKLKDPEFLENLRAWKADLFVVVAFRMLPEEVWKMPPLGTFNLHAALLPQYRGAAPINWAVINGERMTGVTSFMIDEHMDTGGIMLRSECRILPEDNAGSVHDKLIPLACDVVLHTVEGIIQKNIETRVQRSFIQGSEVLRPAPKISRELCHIDWDAPTMEIHNLVRGLSPTPTAFTEFCGQDGTSLILKIFETSPVPCDQLGDALSCAPGTIVTDGKSRFWVRTSDGAIALEDLQLSGKKRMKAKAFLAGFRDLGNYSLSKGSSSGEIARTR